MPTFDARFEPSARGARFLITHAPDGPTRGTIVFAPPFAEEMNRSRNMVHLAARAFAEAGWRVVLTDLFGCGDSAGDHGDAHWEHWVDDLQEALTHAPPTSPCWLWALRGGALFVPPLLQSRPDAQVLLWHPVLDGQQHFGQFLRLKSAGSVASAQAGVDRKTLLAQLERGEPIEVAGYAIAPALEHGMSTARAEPQTHASRRIVWLEVKAAPEAPSLMRTHADAWRTRGHDVRFESVVGLPFWQTQEVARCPALIDVSLAAFDSASAAATSERQ